MNAIHVAIVAGQFASLASGDTANSGNSANCFSPCLIVPDEHNFPTVDFIIISKAIGATINAQDFAPSLIARTSFEEAYSEVHGSENRDLFFFQVATNVGKHGKGDHLLRLGFSQYHQSPTQKIEKKRPM